MFALREVCSSYLFNDYHHFCFLLYRRDVVYNFLYRKPKPLRHSRSWRRNGHARHIGYWFRLALHYILTKEPTIQSCFRREFWWGRHWLHPDHLSGCSTRVVREQSLLHSL